MIYLDNAATSFPKPRRVIAEQTRCMQLYCGNAGRGSHKLAMASAEKIFECRQLIADFFRSEHPENVSFALNTTMALNFAIKGLLQKGDHVLISDMEHNAVYRPISRLASEGYITFDVFPTFVLDQNRSSARICSAIAHLIKSNTKMLICSHSSNICSVTMPLAEIGALCRRKGIVFVVDAAQSAGHLKIDVDKMKIDALCVPGHKGLMGPQGCGFVLWGEAVLPNTLIEGGSGYQSLEAEMPSELPERMEAGTLPTPAIAGLCEGIREVTRIGTDEISSYEKQLFLRLWEMLSHLDGVTVYVPQYQGSILLFGTEKMSSDVLGNELNKRGFCVRSGFHCSALGHQTLQTPIDGAVRVSPGIYTKMTDIDAFFLAVKDILT